MYLVDTNVWLERLLKQERSEEVNTFFQKVSSDRLFITDFSFHSIGIILSNLSKRELLTRFVTDIFKYGSVGYITLPPIASELIVKQIEQFNLDFDDAYQYTAAEKYNLEIVSFDSDFDRTKRGRKTPIQIIDFVL